MRVAELLSQLGPEEQAAFEAHTSFAEFPAESCILKAGTQGDCCYFIESGQVRIQMDRAELDTDDVMGYLDPGAILGELSLLDQRPRSASAYAETDVVARCLRREAIDHLATENPRIGMLLVQILGRSAADKLRQTNERLADALFQEHDPEVDQLVSQARIAQAQIHDWPEERIEPLLHSLAHALADRAEELAELTVRETRLGNVADKVVKNRHGAFAVLESLRAGPGRGPLGVDESRKVTEWAAPMGVIFGLIPMTAPAATATAKALISIKSRNALIMSFHRRALAVANRTGEIMQEVLRSHGAPVDLIQWVRVRNSRKKTEQFMRHPGVSLILATGGSSMVKAAYSSGTPAIGVGPGNAPTLICTDADLEHAAVSIVASKAFDHGLICGAEHNLVVDARVAHPFVSALKAQGAAVLTPEETARFTERIFHSETHALRMHMVGVSAATLASAARIERDYPIRLVVVPTRDVTPRNPYAREKMTPILSLFAVESEEAGLQVCRDLLAIDGAGHTAIIHTRDPALVERFAAAMPVSRILVNSPGTFGVTGWTTGLTPSCTLGCGTYGGTSTTDNVSYRHLLNIKRVAHFIPPAVPFLERG